MSVDWPEITIVVCTYERPDCIRDTVSALASRFMYPPDKIWWMIADDVSPSGYAKELIYDPVFSPYAGVAVVSPPINSGWGVNVNNALRSVTTKYIYFTEDDYVLTKELDARVPIAIMESHSHIGMLRLRGTAGDHMVFHQFEADIKDYIDSHRDGKGLPGKATYLQLDSGSPSLYLYSNGPHFRTTAFNNFYGPYREGLKLGATEETYAHIVKDGMKTPNAPAIAILPEWIAMHFEHIGKSYQHTESDRGAR